MRRPILGMSPNSRQTLPGVVCGSIHLGTQIRSSGRIGCRMQHGFLWER
jgi:hypothetical protein